MKRTLILALVFGLTGGAALAHAHLTAETPEAHATVTAPRQLVLQFSEDLELAFSGVDLSGPGAAAVRLGTGTLSHNDTTLTVPIEGALAPGTYTVNWHVLSKDGHRMHGTYSFTVK